MTLSIRAAARAAGARPAVITPSATLDVAALAAAADAAALPSAAPGHAAPLLATADVATVVAIVAALERRAPLALIPARTSADERAALIARVAATPVPADTAFVVFTAGSTGRPKGVVLSRAAAHGAAAIHAAHLGWRDDDAWLLALPLGHVGGLAIVVRCLAARRPIVLGDVHALAHPAVTLASLVPAHKSGEFFGFYSVFEKFSSIFGPLLFSITIAMTGSSRNAILGVIVFWIFRRRWRPAGASPQETQELIERF